jgi:hypothetical protein
VGGNIGLLLTEPERETLLSVSLPPADSTVCCVDKVGHRAYSASISCIAFRVIVSNRHTINTLVMLQDTKHYSTLLSPFAPSLPSLYLVIIGHYN